MPATIQRWGRGLLALVALAALAACTIGREPAYDAAIAGEVTALTAETLRLFQDFAPGTTGTHAGREPRYRALAARAETIRLMAQARGSALPANSLILRAAQFRAGKELAADIAPEAAERLAEYQDATPAYMADYLRNLARLEIDDRAGTGDRSAKIAAHQVALAAHQAEMEAYLEAFRRWQAGAGPQPPEPAPPPPAPTLGMDPTAVALRITVIEDILRDALVYERDILNRNR